MKLQSLLNDCWKHSPVDRPEFNEVIERIESLPALTADVITARALAPLPLLCKLAQPLCHAETVCLFLKGRSAQEELTETQKQTTLQATLIASQTDSEGVLIKVRNLHHDVAR